MGEVFLATAATKMCFSCDFKRIKNKQYSAWHPIQIMLYGNKYVIVIDYSNLQGLFTEY